MNRPCWEIIGCDTTSPCPARTASQPCWEIMAEKVTFQCHYGLCEECIVYLMKSVDSGFPRGEMEKVMRDRLAN